MFSGRLRYNFCSYLTIVLLIRKTTHLEKVEEDRIRDQMLTEAGYLVKRYTNIPTVRQLQKDIH
ncbi:hypothetical protein JRG06_01570 [Acinetobacter pittii]|nr:hypothetical protein [Acinetobacter pittii]MBA0129943.1 hypothetical protein [Acinetobacter pittii]MBA0133554.1 hypothetical protein [Acinetobacter pittii]MBA0150733.1 hypothetical protein [Acinetobacter pittii]MBN6991470.1 hypothetical protein [Acinetobacter pittii]